MIEGGDEEAGRGRCKQTLKLRAGKCAVQDRHNKPKPVRAISNVVRFSARDVDGVEELKLGRLGVFVFGCRCQRLCSTEDSLR